MKLVTFILVTFLLSNVLLYSQTEIRIISEPDLSVYLDNEFQGKTNIKDEGLILKNVIAGDHIIKIVKNGFKPYKEEINVKGKILRYVVQPSVFEKEVEINGQNDSEKEDQHLIYIVEDMPIFRPNKCKTSEEGNIELQKFIVKNIEYPDIARERGVQGKVYIRFVVNSNGKVTDVEVARGVDLSIDNEALRVIKMLPDFSPGRQDGKPVSVSYTVPINFKLGKKSKSKKSKRRRKK